MSISPLVPNIVRQLMYIQDIEKMVKDVSKLTPQLNENFYSLPIKNQLANLFSRIAKIRQLNYRSQTNLEIDQIKAVELWASISPSIKEHVESDWAATTLKEILALSLEIEARRNTPEYYEGDIRSLSPLQKKVAAHKASINDFSSRIQRSLATLYSCIASLEERVSTAETAINLTSMASFKLKEGEIPIIALKAKDMNKKIEVLLTFTNQRLIYESMTTKKTEKQLLLERPVSSVTKIAKGKVGLLAGEGLYVEFKQPSDPKLKLDTKGEDADLAVRYFSMITSGQIDDELKSSISVTVCERSKELARSYAEEIAGKEESKIEAPGENIGKCKECGTVVSSPIKKWTMDGGLEIGLFDCPTCKKSFREILNKKTINTNSEIASQ